MSCLMYKVNVYRLQPIKEKKYDFLNVWRSVVRHDFIYAANVVLLHSGTRLDSKRM